MLKKIVFLVVATASLALGSVAFAQTASEMLEKGIYTEETVGDLDAAIKIYEKILAEDEANRQFVAQAQFRLGKCLAKQGKKKEAEEVFRELVDRFQDSPAQKELVEQARKLLPAKPMLTLKPVPWNDGEQTELRLKLAGGLDLGAFTFSARKATVDGREVWDMRSVRNIMMSAPNLGFSQVIADRETFEPIRSIFRHSLLGTCETEYSPGEATVHTTSADGKKSDRTMTVAGVYYDNEQGWFVFRRLPLAEDYKGNLPVFSPLGAGPISLPAEVTGKEKVETPAGTFECYKLLLGVVQQTFWISADAHRYVVKFEAGGVIGILQSIRQVKPGDTITEGDEQTGFTVTAPADWCFIPLPASAKKEKKGFVVVDPDAEAVTAIRVWDVKSLSDEERTSVRAWADKRLAASDSEIADLKVRKDSWQELKIGGLPAVECLADFQLGAKPRAMVQVFILGESTAAVFSAHTVPDQLDDFRKKFAPVIESYKEK